MTKCPVCLQENDDTALICTSCGFKFSGKTTSFKPISFDQTQNASTTPSEVAYSSQNTSPAAQNSPYLRVLQGPQGEILIPLSNATTTIGRSPDCDVFLNDRTVSRTHAQVTYHNGEYQIADLNSFNGLWINNQNTSIKKLVNGDIIQIGIFFIRFELI